MGIAELRAYLDGHLEEMLGTLKALVEHESPSTDKATLDALAEVLVAQWQGLGATAEVVDGGEHGNHVLVRVPAESEAANAQPPAMIIGHFDTVWPAGTLTRKPFAVDGGRATGPGIYDMKGGLAIAEWALRAIQAVGAKLPRPVVLVLNADEETGSATSRALIEAEARTAVYVLVLEPAMVSGAVKTSRKGVGGFKVEVTGLASHAGGAPQEGVSAIEELARQILRLHSFTDYKVGTTVNAGVIEGGTRSNVVAAHARAEVDTRASTKEEAHRLTEQILSIQPFDERTQVDVTGYFDRMPLERTEGTVALFRLAQRLGYEMGVELEEASSGGGSDGNFTSALGVPTLDGLGVVGDGAHAEHEYIEVASLPERAAIVAGLLLEAGS